MKLADLTAHHIEGIALHGDTPFNVPLFSHIKVTYGWVDALLRAKRSPAVLCKRSFEK